MMSSKKCLLWLISWGLVTGLMALSATTKAALNEDPFLWYGFFGKSEVGQGYSWWTETQLRHNMESAQMGQTLVRTGLLKAIPDSLHKSEVGLLYAFIQTGLTKEHRLALQHSMSYLGAFTGLSHRLRYEFRSLEGLPRLSDRIRVLLRYSGQSRSLLGQFVLWDEIFLNVSSQPTDAIDRLDRNRFFIGFRRPVGTFQLEYGYLNQWAPRRETGQMDHIATLYLFF